MELGAIIDALYESELNCEISTFWDDGFTVKLGDVMNGFVAIENCKTALAAAQFLDNAVMGNDLADHARRLVLGATML